MKANMREVRCCCDARFLGYLPSYGTIGGKIRFRCSPQEILEFEVEHCGEVIDGEPVMFHAYKSRDYPIEKLRQIPEWVDR